MSPTIGPCQDNSRINTVGCTASPINPAKPINTPNPVGISAMKYNQRKWVSAVTARSEIAMAISASDRSNWSSR